MRCVCEWSCDAFVGKLHSKNPQSLQSGKGECVEASSRGLYRKQLDLKFVFLFFFYIRRWAVGCLLRVTLWCDCEKKLQ